MKSRGLPLLVSLLVISCVKKENLIWTIDVKGGSAEGVLFDEEDAMIYISVGGDLAGFELKTGQRKWHNNQILDNNVTTWDEDGLFLQSAALKSILHINRRNGHTLKEFKTTNVISSKLITNNTQLYFIEYTKEKPFCVKRLDTETGSIERVFISDGIRGIGEYPIVEHKGLLIFSVRSNGSIRLIYAIDKLTGKLKWKKSLSGPVFPDQTPIVHYRDSIFFIDKALSKLVEVDVFTGKEVQRINVSENTHVSIDSDGKYILIHSKQLTVYSLLHKESYLVDDNYGLKGVISEERVFYEKSGRIFMFDLRKKKKTEIYNLEGKELYNIFVDNKYVLINYAKNLRMAVADGLNLSFTLLRI